MRVTWRRGAAGQKADLLMARRTYVDAYVTNSMSGHNSHTHTHTHTHIYTRERCKGIVRQPKRTEKLTSHSYRITYISHLLKEN